MDFLREIAVVALRDGRRLARRESTVLIRVAISAAGIATVLTAWRVLPNGSDQAAFGVLGRDIFSAWRVLVLAATWGLAPLAVAQGVQEEREAGTLDMLALSSMRTRSLFAGVVLARVAAIALVVLGSVPVLGVALGLGGFGVPEILATTLHAFSGLLVLSGVAGVFALVARHPLLPAVATWMWAGVSYAGVPLLAMGVLDLGPRHHSEINPFLGALWETTGLQGVLLMGLTTLGVAAFAGPVLDIALSQDESDDFGALSPSRWVLERTQRVAWLWLIAAVVTTVLLWPLDLGFWMFEGLWWSIALAVLSALQTATSVVLLTNGIDWLHGLGRRGAVRTAEAMRRGLLEHTDVGDDPIYWRDHQFGSPTARIVGGFSAVGLLGITGVTALSSLREAHDIIPPLGFVAAVITGLLPGVACAVEETRTGSWSLLATTTITPIRLVLGKLKATARAALPMLLLSLGLWAVLRGLYTPHSTWSTCEVTLPDKGDMGRMLWTGLWVLLQPLWLSALALWVSLRGGTRWAWPVVVVAVLACIGGPVQLRHTGMGPLMELLVPFLFHEVWSCAPRRLPPELLASTMLYGAFLVLFGALAARNLRAH